MKYLYNDYIPNFQKQILAFFDLMKANYNFDHGDEFEIAVCHLLRNIVPRKYGITRGFVVSKSGVCIGDDIVIFDQERFPTFRLLPDNDFARKQEVPIEAVHAYIEAKHKLDSRNLKKSIEQVAAVKKLVSQRESVQLYQNDPYIQASQKPSDPLQHLPTIRNPVFGMVLARHGVARDSKKIRFFFEEHFFGKDKSSDYEYYPELIVVGKDNFLTTSFLKEDGETKPTIFHVPNNGKTSGYQNMVRPDMAFAIAITHLMAALDFQRLGKMPWEQIMNEAKLGGSGEER